MMKKLFVVAFATASFLGASDVAPESTNLLAKQAAAFAQHATAHITQNPKQVLAVVACVLLARPVYQLCKELLADVQASGYGFGSLFGCKLGQKAATDVKDLRQRLQLSLGSLDVKLVLPAWFSAAKKDVATNPVQMDFLSALVAQFSPYLHVGIEDQTTPLVRDKEVSESVVTKVKRLFFEISCGTFKFRSGIDLQEAVLVPCALVAMALPSYLAQQNANSASAA